MASDIINVYFFIITQSSSKYVQWTTWSSMETDKGKNIKYKGEFETVDQILLEQKINGYKKLELQHSVQETIKETGVKPIKSL